MDEFWLKWYGHPPDGKAGFGVAPHRLYAFDAASSVLAGGIHWQNPKVRGGEEASLGPGTGPARGGAEDSR